MQFYVIRSCGLLSLSVLFLAMPLLISAATVATGKIAFTSPRDGTDHIYAMNSDGSGLVRLTNTVSKDSYVSWSSDGTQLVFQRQNNGAAIYTMNADGSNVQRLSPTPGFDAAPSWSSDGSQIVFNRVDDPGTNSLIEIMVMNTDGTNAHTILPANGTYNLEPQWSPDGSKILFMSGLDGTQQIYTVNPDGTNVTKITSVGSNGDPRWSPDGTRISFGSDREGGGKLNIYTAKADGSDVQQVTFYLPPIESGDTAWSSDGTRLAFEWDINGARQSNPGAYAEVHVIRTDGTVDTSTHQPCSGVGCSPDWQPAMTVRIIRLRGGVHLRGGSHLF